MSESMDKRVADLQRRIADLEARLPRHSVPAAMLIEMEELQEALEHAPAEAVPEDRLL